MAVSQARTVSFLIAVLVFTPNPLKGQEAEPETKNQEQWQPIAYLPFSPSATGIIEALRLSAAERTLSTTSSGSEKVRTERLTTVDPVTGKTISEVETIRSGTSNNATTVKNTTLVITLETLVLEKKNPKVDREYRAAIEGNEFFELNEKELKQASKIASEYLRARRLVARGAKGKPFVDLFLGDKEKGFVVYHETSKNQMDQPVKLRLWIKGKPYDLQATDAAAGFIDDVANYKAKLPD